MNSQLAIPQDLLEFVKSLASETRMSILLLFLDGQERTVSQVTEAIGLGQPTTSEQLAVMKRSGVLTSEKRGKEVYYRPNRLEIARQLEYLSSLLKQCCVE
jgi:ArsR family transcriptional regulator